jgi:hypothetical protein
MVAEKCLDVLHTSGIFLPIGLPLLTPLSGLLLSFLLRLLFFHNNKDYIAAKIGKEKHLSKRFLKKQYTIVYRKK